MTSPLFLHGGQGRGVSGGNRIRRELPEKGLTMQVYCSRLIVGLLG